MPLGFSLYNSCGIVRPCANFYVCGDSIGFCNNFVDPNFGGLRMSDIPRTLGWSRPASKCYKGKFCGLHYCFNYLTKGGFITIISVYLLIHPSTYLYIQWIHTYVERKYVSVVFHMLCKFCAHWRIFCVILWRQSKMKTDLFRWFLSLMSE